MKRESIPLLVFYPALKIVFALSAGISLSQLFKLPEAYQHIYLFALSLIVLLSIVFWTKIANRTLFIGGLILVAALGYYRAESSKIEYEQSLHRLEEIGLLGDSLTLSGVVKSVKQNRNGEFQHIVKLDSINEDGKLIFKSTFLVHVNAEEEFKTDEHLILSVRYKKFQTNRNPYQFDYLKYLKSIQIIGQFELTRVIQKVESQDFFQIKNQLNKTIESIFKTENIGIAKALLVGNKSDLDPEMKKEFSRSGLAHLMAVSGLHVGFIIAPFWFLIPYFWTTKRGRLLGFFLILSILLLYAWVTGFSASVVRASIMAALFSYGKLFDKIRYPINIVAVAAFVLLVYKPDYLFDVGFQLSFGAVSIILLLSPILKLIPIKEGRLSSILNGILIGITVQLGLAPLLIHYFGELSVVSPISNLVALFPASCLVQGGLIATILGSLFPSSIPLFTDVLNFLASTLAWFATTFSSNAFSYVTVEPPNAFFLIFWMCFIITIAVSPNKKIRWTWVLITLISFGFWRGFNVFHSIQKNEFELTVLDVGQGDANVIQTPKGKTLLIDTGVWSPNYNSGKSVVLPYLAKKSVKEIEAIFLSHPHADHIGGTLDILNQLKVNRLYVDTSQAVKSALFERIIQLAKEKEIPIFTAYMGDSILIEKDVNVQVLWPPKQFKDSNVNEYSTVLRVDYGKTSFLFVGDAEEHAEEWMSSTFDEILNTDYLKMGHHGSRSSSHQPFLEDNTPEFVTVSSGKINKYKHPHAESMFRLNQFTKNIHFTSLEGAAILLSDGERIEKLSWHKDK